MNRRFPSVLPSWEFIPEPPPSEASSDNEPQYISQSQPTASLGGRDGGSKRPLSGQTDNSAKRKKQRLGQLGNKNDLPSFNEPVGAPGSSFTQPVASNSSSTSDPTSRRVQMRKPTNGNYPKRTEPPLPVPSTSNSTAEASSSKPVSSRRLSQPAKSTSASDTSRPRPRDDRSKDDVATVAVFSSSNSIGSPVGGEKGKGKAKETSDKPVESARRKPFNTKSHTRIQSASSGDDDDDDDDVILAVRHGQSRRRESGKSRAEKSSDGNKMSNSSVREGKKPENITTKPIKRSMAEKERRHLLGDAVSRLNNGTDNRNGKPGRKLGKRQAVQPAPEDIIELSSDNEPMKQELEVIEISDASTPPPSTQRKRKTSDEKSVPSTIIDLTIDDGSEDGRDEAPASAQFMPVMEAQSVSKDISANEETKPAQDGFTGAAGVDLMVTDEGSMIDVAFENVENRVTVDNTGPNPSISTPEIYCSVAEVTPIAQLQDGVIRLVTSSSTATGRQAQTQGTSKTHLPQIKQQPVSPMKEDVFATQRPSSAAAHPGLGSPFSSTKEESPSLHKSLSSMPEQATRLRSDALPDQPPCSPLEFEPDERPSPSLPPSSDPIVVQEQVTLSSPPLPECSPTGLVSDPGAGEQIPSSNTMDSAPSPKLPVTSSVNAPIVSVPNSISGDIEMVKLQEPVVVTASTEHQRNPLVRSSGRAERKGTQERGTSDSSQSPQVDASGKKSGFLGSRAKVFTARKSTGGIPPKPTFSPPSSSLSNTGLISVELPPVAASEDKIARAKARWRGLPSEVPNAPEASPTSTATRNDDSLDSRGTATSSKEDYSSLKNEARTPSVPLLKSTPVVESVADEQEIIDLTTLLESSDDDESLDEDAVLRAKLLAALVPRPAESSNENPEDMMVIDDAQERSPEPRDSSKFPSPSEQLSSDLASTLKMDVPLDQAPRSTEEEEEGEWLEYLDEKDPEPSDGVAGGRESPALVYPEGSDHEIEPIDDVTAGDKKSPPTPEPSTDVPEVPILEEELSGRALRSRSSSSSAGLAPLRRSARTPRSSSRMSSLSANTDILNIQSKDVVEEKLSFGGLTVLTWSSFRCDLNNFQPKCYWSTDLPHAFHDHVNWLSEDHRNNAQMRHILESVIIENTSEEPHAPHISIKNGVDSIPTPPWEFYYTNKMFHSPNVPAPSIKRLGSCGCMGKCRPDTCACAKRQKEYTESYVAEGFVYDKHRCLLQGGIPIFECNSLCRCDDDCMNRVVQHGRKVEVSLFKTPNKGWGVVNGSKKIPRGQFIGVYSGEYLTQDEAETRGKLYNKFGRTYLFDCDLWIFTGGARYTIDAYHAGNFTRFLNHSCDPNAHFGYVYIDEDDIYKPLLCVFARHDIAPGEEITFSYTGDPDAGLDADGGDTLVKKKKAKSKTPRTKKSDTVYSTCHCGAENCTGILFN